MTPFQGSEAASWTEDVSKSMILLPEIFDEMDGKVQNKQIEPILTHFDLANRE